MRIFHFTITTIKATCLAGVMMLMSSAPALPQTVLEQPEGPPVKPGQGQVSAAPVPTQAATPQQSGSNVLPNSAVNDAIAQREGNFPILQQPSELIAPVSGVTGGMIQDAWNAAPLSAGTAQYRQCAYCVYRVRTRELMITTIILPDSVIISNADLGDPSGFAVEIRADNMLAVRPTAYGMDTNLNIYTDAGVFAFYLRSEGFNSNHVPDLVVRVIGQGKLRPGKLRPGKVVTGSVGIADPSSSSTASTADAAKDDKASIEKDASLIKGGKDILAPLKPRHESGDFVERVEFDPGKLHGFEDYELWGDESMAPETIFRDEHFTYIQFGDKWNAIELPVAFVVIDSIDEQVNTRVQGRTYIIESVAPLITLKSGTSFICIKYGGTA